MLDLIGRRHVGIGLLSIRSDDRTLSFRDRAERILRIMMDDEFPALLLVRLIGLENNEAPVEQRTGSENTAYGIHLTRRVLETDVLESGNIG